MTYEVTGSPGDVTDGPAGSSLTGSVPMKVTKTLGSPVYYSLEAQLQGGGSVTVEILVDCKVISKGTAIGGYNIASAEISQDPLMAPASSASPGFTGYHWQVVAIGHGGKVTPIPARLGVALQFSPGGQFGAFDGISFHWGTYRATTDSFTTSAIATTANGYAGDNQTIVLARLVLGSFGPATYPVRLTGDRLVVDVGSYTLTCHRAGPQADAPAPASTG